ncbi:MAG: PQQ-binding-like beta-propeller repeat protein [Planctomycetota bacterium]
MLSSTPTPPTKSPSNSTPPRASPCGRTSTASSSSRRGQYPGPHSTPLLAAGVVVVAGVRGHVRALDWATGKLVWQRDLVADFGAVLPQSGYAASPLLAGTSVVLPAMGSVQAAETEFFGRPPDRPGGPGAVALDVATGNTVWQTEDFRSSHASPIAISVGGTPVLLFHGMFELVGVDPTGGGVLFRHLLRREAADNVSFTPLWDASRSQAIVSHGYRQAGAQAIGVARESGRWRHQTHWQNRQLGCVETNATLVGDSVVGTGRAPRLVVIDPATGRTTLRRRLPAEANFIALGPQLIGLDQKGGLFSGSVTATSDPPQWQPAWRRPALAEPAWTAPSIIGRTLLVRNATELQAWLLPAHSDF